MEINEVRIRIKKESENKGSKIIISQLINGDVLPSVSTRDKRRANANVWTSGNRIFKVNNTNKFIKLLNEYKKGEDAKSEDSKTISDFIDTVTNIERDEYNNYLEWLYNEMERQID